MQVEPPTFSRPPAPALPSIEACATTARIDDIAAGPEGLTIRASGGIVARVADMQRLSAPGMAGFAELVIELPGASLGPVAPFTEWPAGPFSSMRARLYRTDTDCGVRLRVQPRVPGEVTITPIVGGVLIAPRISPIEQRAREAQRQEAQGAPLSGEARLSATFGASKIEGTPAVLASQVQIGASQRIPHVGTLRGFIADVHPRSTLGAPYGALALTGADLDLAVVDLAAGDLYVSFGDAGGSTGAQANALVIRGAGTSMLLRGGIGLQVYGGLAARSSFQRLPDLSGVTSELSDDHVYGAQLSWGTRTQTFAAAAGAAHSVPLDGPAHDNFVQTLELQPWTRAGVRVLVEESRADIDGTRRTGEAITVEPRASTGWLMVNGSLRYTSADFRPPLASTFFANLRESYQLNATWLATRRLTLNASWGQTKSFNFFDPQDVGTLTSARSGAASFQATSWLQLAADYVETEQVSDAGALLPANSLTHSLGLGSSTLTGHLSTRLRVSYDWIDNRANPDLDLHSVRGRLDGRWDPGRRWGLFGRATYALSSHGEYPAGQNYAVAFGGHAALERGADLRGEVGHQASPAGIFDVGSRASYVSAAVRSPVLLHVQGAIQGSYQLLEPLGAGIRQGWTVFATITAAGGWGAAPRPGAPSDSRAMPLAQTRRGDLISSTARVHVFEDRNGNGRQDRGEPSLPGVAVAVDGVQGVTGASGVADLRVAGFETRAELPPEGVAADYFLANPVRQVELPGMGRTNVWFGLRPAGRVEGRVTFAPPEGAEVAEAPSLGGLRVVIRGNELERDAATADDGTFSFGVLPAGPYQVELDRRSLPPELTVAGPAQVSVSIAARERREVQLTLRPATVRERLNTAP